MTNDRDEKFLISGKLGLVMRIRESGYIPKSGLLIAEQLIRLKVSGKALDIGTGETGFLANCLIALGASSVVASDIDPQAIEWAAQASNRCSEINWSNCDLFSNELEIGTFSTIVSNPPQMPMPHEGPPHDYGGPDGRSIITRIIDGSTRLLSRNGKLVMLCFDFLGVDHSYGQKSLIEFALSRGLTAKIIATHQRTIRKGGKTEENIGWIEAVCPSYVFQKDNHGNYFHEVHIVEMRNTVIST